MRHKPWAPGTPCPKCGKPVMTEGDKFKKGHNQCRRCGNFDQSRRRQARRQPRIPREKPVKAKPIKEPMTCTKCKEKPQKKNSIKGMCEDCTKEDNAAKSRLRAADQHRRRMAGAVVVLCACGCGEKCRPNATYTTKQHRETHERETREKHKQPRATVKPPDDYKLKHMSTVEVLPLADTLDERAKVAAMLERARQNRITLTFSRFEGDRDCLMEGR